MKKKIVFVGLSGGVDSAVSAAILQTQGYEVVGVFIKTWHPDFLVCNEEEEHRDAMRVAAHLDIPFLTFDLEDVYKKEVADYMIREYKMGRTPNPDVMCNKEVKFGAFFKKAILMGADFVATGHYAQKKDSLIFFPGPRISGSLPQPDHVKNIKESFLLKGFDPSKDQSYFLWTLKQEQLNRILFPVGNLKKTEVRKLAKKFNLPVAEKKDSQGVCFLGKVDLKEFLKHYIKSKKGKVINVLNKEEIGYHDGVVFYTLGERHGFTIIKKTPQDGAYYIVDKDVKKNILYVSQKFANKDLIELIGSEINLENLNWISEIPKINKIYTAQIRYHGEFLPCQIVYKNNVSVKIVFKKSVLVASGQSCVLYDGYICMGGGIVV
ncbi:MAG: tRNA 2-thiouridine(34) synthase MnmA [Candidatus Paceibacterota bacterium]